MLVGLHFVEVATLANLETVVAVELEKRRDARVLASHALHTSDGVTRLQDGAVPPVAEVEGLLTLPGVDSGVVAGHKRIALDNPHQLLTGVVEVQLQLVGRAGDGLRTSELQGLNQVLVRDLGELAALIRVEVDVVDIERGGLQVGGRHTVADGVQVGGDLRSVFPAQVAQVIELQVDTNLVVLQGNQRESQARVAAEPELQRDVQSVRRGAVQGLVGGVGLTASAVIVTALATLNQQVGQGRHVANHLGITGLLSSLLGELIPDVQPVSVVLVNALATDFELNTLNQVVSNPVQPAELSTRAVSSLENNRGKGGLQVHAVDQVTITLDRARNTLAEARRAVERVLNGLHGKVGVTPVHRLEEGNLGITSQIHVLRAIGNQLH